MYFGTPLRKFAAVAALSIVLVGIGPGFGITFNVPKRSRVRARVPQSEIFTYDVQGPSTAVVSGETNQNVTFVDMALAGQNATLGEIRMTLNPAYASTGTLQTFIPRSRKGTFNPSTHTQDFYVVIEASALGPTPLISNTPIKMQGTLPSLTPASASYNMISPPVDFYRSGDVGQATVLTITDIQTEISGVTIVSDVPALSLLSMVILVMLLLVLGTLAIRRKLRSVG